MGQSETVKPNKVIFVDADAWYLTGAGLDNPTIILKEISATMQKLKQYDSGSI